MTNVKTFASTAYLQCEEKNVYRLYRDILVEFLENGVKKREKTGKSICISPFPLREFNTKEDDEKMIVVRTFHPTEHRVIKLVEIH